MFRKFGTAVVVLLILLTLAPAGSPVTLSYVYSDSMEPTIDTGDGFLLVPAGDVTVGDVVTFRSESGEFVTHRVVDRTDAGYVTKGDGNPSTDQSAGASPVAPDDVVGRVLTVGGHPVTMPYYGTLVSTVRDHRVALLLVAAALLLLPSGLRRRTRGRAGDRSVVRVQDVLLPALAVSLLAAGAFGVAAAPTQSVTYVAVAHQSGAPGTVTVGEPRETSLRLNRSPSPLTHAIVSVRGADVRAEHRNGSTVALDVRIPPQATTGPHRVAVTVDTYPAVLPRSVVTRLHAVHPLLAAVAAGGVLFVAFALASLLLVDRRAILRGSRRRWLRSPGGDRGGG